MKINNITQIKAEDFEEDDQAMAEQIGNVLNPFMQQVVEINDKRIDFENRVENYREVEFTVDANGTPVLNNKMKTGKNSIRGTQIVAAYNLTNTAGYPTQQPFISFQVIAGGFIQVNRITGLIANNKYRLHIIFY
jgi:hypothetical protein